MPPSIGSSQAAHSTAQHGFENESSSYISVLFISEVHKAHSREPISAFFLSSLCLHFVSEVRNRTFFQPILTLSLSNSSFHSNILEAHKAHTHCSINDLLFPDFISEVLKAHQQNFYLPSIHSTIFWRCTRHHFLTSFLRRTRRTHKTPSEALFILHYLRGTQGTHSLPNT